jgi:hypothetical protein
MSIADAQPTCWYAEGRACAPLSSGLLLFEPQCVIGNLGSMACTKLPVLQPDEAGCSLLWRACKQSANAARYELLTSVCIVTAAFPCWIWAGADCASAPLPG